MKLAREILICCALIALSAFLVCGAMFFATSESAIGKVDINARLDQLDRALGQTNSQLQALVKDGKDSLDANYYDIQAQVETTTVILRSLSETVDTVNKKLLPSATVAVNNLGSAASNGANAAQSLQGAVDQLGAVATALKDDAVAAKPTIDGATGLLGTLNAGSADALDRLRGTITDVDALVKNASPIERNMETTSASIAHGTTEMDKITVDAAEYVHNLTHPEKKGFWRQLAVALLGPAARIIIDHAWPERIDAKIIK